jgi:hypothetical protein
MDQDTKDSLETVNFIKDRILTRDDVRLIARNSGGRCGQGFVEQMEHG